jgi:hypothetical protein
MIGRYLLPWGCAMAIAVSLAHALDTVIVGAWSANSSPPSVTVSSIDACSLRLDFMVYADDAELAAIRTGDSCGGR